MPEYYLWGHIRMLSGFVTPNSCSSNGLLLNMHLSGFVMPNSCYSNVLLLNMHLSVKESRIMWSLHFRSKLSDAFPIEHVDESIHM